MVRSYGGSLRARRCAVLLVASLGLLTCSDGASGPGRPGFAALAVIPLFSASAGLAGLPIDNVRLVVVRPPRDTMLDKGYAFPAGETQLSISESVPLQTSPEVLNLTLQYLSGDVLLFSGSMMAEVHAAPAPDEPVAVPVAYVGPGAEIATLAVSPRDTVVSFGAALPLRVTAADSQGRNVTQFYVSWRSSDPDQTPDATGTLRVGSSRMTLRLIARSPPTGASDSTTVRVAAPVAGLVKTGGDNQTGPVNTRLPQPLEVEVRGTDNLPVPGVEVTFTAPTGGSLDGTTAITDASGRARMGATLGSTPGDHSYTASAVGAGSVTFSATATQEVLPTVAFTTANQSVGEGVGTATLTARLSSASTQVVTVPYTVGGTASRPADYSITASPLTIPAGSTTGTITVTVVNDAVVESSETVVVTLGAPTNATLGAITGHTLTITDNDVSLTVLFSGRGFGTVATQGAAPAINCTTGDPPAACAATYPLGAQVTLLATPVPTGEGIFRFEDWTGTGSGFTCTTSTTCVVNMNQSRQVTARFSTIGTLSLSPSSAAFTQPELGTATPASVQITATNVGERPLTLSPTIPISYTPSVASWLSAGIDKLVIDTLSPATLTLRVLSNQLAAGTYGATVFLRDDGLQFSWPVTVTLTVTVPTPPVLSNISYVQVGAINTCDIFGGPLGTYFRTTYSYSDADGDVRTGATVFVNYVFANDSSGSFDDTQFSTIGGDGFTGTIQSDMCFLFGGASFVDASIRVTDLAGAESQPITVRILRPSGAN